MTEIRLPDGTVYQAPEPDVVFEDAHCVDCGTPMYSEEGRKCSESGVTSCTPNTNPFVKYREVMR